MEEKEIKTNNESGGNYWGWAMLVGFLVFIGIWIYAMATWGLLIGLLIGWLPALIGGVVGGVLWPLIVIFVIYIIYTIYS
jgi:hypothetical protein